MGLDIHSAKFLRNEVKQGLKLEQMLTLGRQGVYMDAGTYEKLLASLGVSREETGFADDFFRGLGAKSISVMDISNYEGANVLHDMNEPLDEKSHEKYDCVFDGGSLEHVFNLPQALKNCMEMVKVGGHFVTITPGNAYCGHGFYQFSPELFYSALSEENGYSVERLLFVSREQWYSVRSPADVRGRVELLTDRPTLLFVSAKRLERRPVFATWPQQSDYCAAWVAGEQTSKRSGNGLKEHVLKWMPWARNLQAHWRRYKERRKARPSNRARFIPVDLD